jgi:hypothetical protein
MKEEDDLRKKVEELERENRALRDAMGRSGRRNVIIVSEGNYQGHPTITFEAGGRPFTLGLRKASVVLYCTEHVKRFVSRHKGEIKDWEIVQASDGSGASGGRTNLQI